MLQSKRLKVSVSPNEILFPESKISVNVDSPLNPEYAQSAITVRDQLGQIQLSNMDQTASWVPETPIAPGQHTLIVGELITKTGEKITGAMEIPFFVTDSVSKVPSDLRVENMTRLRAQNLDIKSLPIDRRPSGKFIEIIKASNRKTGAPIELAFDENGGSIDSQDIFMDIMKNRIRKFGKLHESLYSRLQELDANSRIEVAVWLESRDPSQERSKRLKEKPSRLPREVAEFRMHISEKLGQFSKQLEKTIKVQKFRADPLAPVAYAELNKAQILEIAKRPEVLAIFLHETDGIDDLDDSIAIANSDDVHALGYEGSGVRVAVWENGPDKTDDLTIAGFYDSSQSKTSAHARLTHGIVKNKEKNKPNGHAPSCTLYSANDKSLSALRWAVEDENCRVISQSFHRSSEPGSSSLSFDDIYKDWLVLHWPFPTILQAAGNFWTTDPDNIDPPSDEFVNHKGYNSLAVGNHNDNADAMSGSSVFRNPTTLHGDRELPEICANGTAVTACKITKSGTSMAAPAAASCVALLQSVNSTLKFWPEGCRAIILAGAKRNVRGNTWWQDALANWDARDGSGAIDAYESLLITQSRRARNASATRRGWDVGTLRSSDFGDDKISTFSYKVEVPEGWFWFGPRHVKVALAWNSKVTTLNFLGIEIPLTSNLAVDLDLLIYDSNGNVVSWSSSWDNSYEIAEFEGTPGQIYTIRIRRWSGTDNTWHGIAWTVTGGISIAQAFATEPVLLESVQTLSSVRWRGGVMFG